MNKILVKRGEDVLLFSPIDEQQLTDMMALDTVIKQSLAGKIVINNESFSNFGELTSDYFFNKGLEVSRVFTEDLMEEPGRYLLVKLPQSEKSVPKVKVLNITGPENLTKALTALTDYNYIDSGVIKDLVKDIKSDYLNITLREDLVRSIIKYFSVFGFSFEYLNYNGQ